MDWLLVGLVIFVLLNGIDMILTNAVIKCGGREFNPIVRWIYSKAGIYGMGILKGLVLALFSVQYSAGSLDMWTIWYFDFSFAVILTLMYFDLKKTKVKIIGIGVSNKVEPEAVRVNKE